MISFGVVVALLGVRHGPSDVAEVDDLADFYAEEAGRDLPLGEPRFDPG